MKQRSAEPREPRELPLTLKAQLAVCLAPPSFPARLRHFVHVLALKANYRTGRGFTGQATLARYMGFSRRQVVRLWAELDEAWKRGESPVAAHREARFHTSNLYTIEVREGSWLDTEAGPGVDVTPVVVNVTLQGGQSDMGGTSLCQPRSERGGQSDAHGSITLQRLATANSAVEKELQFSGAPAAEGGRPGATEGRAPTRSELSDLASRLWPEEWLPRAGEDAVDVERRRAAMRKLARRGLAAQ